MDSPNIVVSVEKYLDRSLWQTFFCIRALFDVLRRIEAGSAFGDGLLAAAFPNRGKVGSLSEGLGLILVN